jgi:heme/copper-type cytochrome/quinol oxidase subunit 2
MELDYDILNNERVRNIMLYTFLYIMIFLVVFLIITSIVFIEKKFSKKRSENSE